MTEYFITYKVKYKLDKTDATLASFNSIYTDVRKVLNYALSVKYEREVTALCNYINLKYTYDLNKTIANLIVQRYKYNQVKKISKMYIKLTIYNDAINFLEGFKRNTYIAKYKELFGETDNKEILNLYRSKITDITTEHAKFHMKFMYDWNKRRILDSTGDVAHCYASPEQLAKKVAVYNKFVTLIRGKYTNLTDIECKTLYKSERANLTRIYGIDNVDFINDVFKYRTNASKEIKKSYGTPADKSTTPSTIVNSCLQKYLSDNKTTRKIRNIKLVIRNSECWKYDGKVLEVKLLKNTIRTKFIPRKEDMISIGSIELDKKYLYISCKFKAEPMKKTVGYIGVDRNCVDNIATSAVVIPVKKSTVKLIDTLAKTPVKIHR